MVGWLWTCALECQVSGADCHFIKSRSECTLQPNTNTKKSSKRNGLPLGNVFTHNHTGTHSWVTLCPLYGLVRAHGERGEGQRVRSCEGAGARRDGHPGVNPVVRISGKWPCEDAFIWLGMYLDGIFDEAQSHKNRWNWWMLCEWREN